MKVIIDWMKSLCPISEETVQELEACVTPCRFPKRHLLVREGIFCKYAYFIEKGTPFLVNVCFTVPDVAPVEEL